MVSRGEAILLLEWRCAIAFDGEGRSRSVKMMGVEGVWLCHAFGKRVGGERRSRFSKAQTNFVAIAQVGQHQPVSTAQLLLLPNLDEQYKPHV